MTLKFTIIFLLIYNFSLSQDLVDLGRDTLICINEGFELNPSGDPNYKYSWSTGETTPSIKVFQNGTYSVKVTDPSGKQYTDEINVTFKQERFNQANNWFFGKGGTVEFDPNTGEPKVGSSPGNFDFPAGSSSISDDEGNPLFYTNGSSVYDKNNNVMETGLAGDPNGTQNSIIVPDPGSAKTYFIFTISGGALSYSTVDMSLNNGLGDVVKKNVFLTNNVDDKITAVKTTDGSSVWVITHLKNSNTFLAYKISKSGTSEAKVSPPVQSSVGSITSANKGYLKASPYGSRLVLASGFTEIFHFDSSTGNVSNPTKLNINDSYGVDFSKGGSKIYISTRGTSGSEIYQADLNNPADSTTIKIHQANGEKFGGVQLGPDGKVYIVKEGSGGTSLAVINNPDLPGSQSGFNLNGPSLGAGAGNIGLPNYMQHYFAYPEGPYFEFQDNCIGDLVNFTGKSPLSGKPYINLKFNYAFGDGNTANTQDAAHTYEYPGTYDVTFTVSTDHCDADVIVQKIKIYPYPILDLVDTMVCKGKTITLNAGNPGARYLWSTLDTTREVSLSKGGKYSVKVGYEMCSIQEDFNFISYEPTFELPDEAFICEKDGQQLFLDASLGSVGQDFEWVPVFTNSPRITVDTAGEYTITKVDFNECEAKKTVKVFDVCEPRIFIPNAFTPNGDALNQVYMPQGAHIIDYDFTVFNRWGEIVFHTTTLEEGWDGTFNGAPAPVGTYAYVIKYEGKKEHGTLRKTEHGDLTLLR